ncbi:hypothetical protein BL250_12715 [Erwinia sp. OLTSP20]|nr:hypothetical protein BV501_13475 [Erwinia sp. OAMSP11]PIJ69194.1 hypothetical protein BK416_15265 [Erwinia sp. OLSSP12]PIJ79388.1 hypothetical protein BLD47_14215 [Erwinia sp. OLCASP19]PIJ81500.1 hypothetical protein BLD46_12610 [Erwinia sp. OLMTSP26]PIJ83304.1 hypothetical protein BLD49_13280 [Erwinia sp. OLMDSP33]PIJ89068.1 hypothetical protein BL249_17535 [Erwinia sp. OLFS4]PIJ91271.1 hypothetical protein BL250_12715 [Erwinia sp. OLTSP20]
MPGDIPALTIVANGSIYTKSGNPAYLAFRFTPEVGSECDHTASLRTLTGRYTGYSICVEVQFTDHQSSEVTTDNWFALSQPATALNYTISTYTRQQIPADRYPLGTQGAIYIP